MTVQEQIAAVASSKGVPTSIALAVAQKESGFNQTARGAAGEVGIFQLMPATARGLNVNAADQSQNIQGGVSLLAQLYRQYGDWATALAHYNGGNNPPPVSYTYAEDVLARSEVYGIVEGDEGAPDNGGDYSLASVWPDFSAVPNWAWLATLAAAALLLLLKRD